MTHRQFEISFRLSGSNDATQRTVITATDSVTARRIFEQQNPSSKVTSTPRDVTARN
jgi:hypothetical protein